MKKLVLPFLGVILFIVLVGLLSKKAKNGFTITPTASPPLLEQETISINEKEILVEVVSTNENRKKGLSNRESLGENQGMLFVFERKAIPSFWMKDMLIPLDIIWIADEKVTQIDKNVPTPEKGTQDKDLKLYTPNGPIDFVLEVNAGFADKNNIKVGDPVVIPSL